MALRRTLSGLTLTVVLVAGIFIPPLWWILPLAVLLAAMGGIYEYNGISAQVEAQPVFILSLTFTLALLLDAHFYGLGHFLVITISAVTLTCLVYTLFRDYPGCITGMASTLFGVFWVGLSLSLGLLILRLEGGKYMFGVLLAVVFMADTGAYVAGSHFGRHKLSPRLSPNKTIEGAVGGFIFSLLAALVCYLLLSLVDRAVFTLVEILVLGGFFGVIGQIGDLVESAIKRDAGVKDSGKTSTGHGGVLDLMDGILFSLPFMYLYLWFTKG